MTVYLDKMPLKRRIPTLAVMAKEQLSELLVHMICSEELYTESDVFGVCSILTNLGQLHTMVETILDKLCDYDASPTVWTRALSTVIHKKTRSVKLKPGWNCGEIFLQNLKHLNRLVYMDITGTRV